MSNAIGIPLPRLSRSRAGDRQTQKYAVNGKVPGFTADFIDNYYSGYTSLSSAITHVRNGNAVMTDGYGPELVVNGGFDSGTDGWTAEADSDVSYDDGKIRLTVANSANRGAYQAIATESGKTYVVDAFLVESAHGNATVRVGTVASGGDLLSEQVGAGSVQLSFTATGTTSYLLLRPNSTINGNSVVFDNVSVREMPVLKWAPHNLIPYSEDFTAWAKVDSSVSSNAVVAPDGTQTADKLIEGTASAHKYALSSTVNVTAGQSVTASCFAKAGERTWLGLGFSNLAGSPFAGGAFTARSAYFNLSTGAKGTVGSSLSSSSIVDVGNGWYFCTITASPTATGTIKEFTTIAIGDVDASYAGDGTSGVYLWGAHLYRSDLGGMAANPDQPPSRASYVPTVSTAEYLPRIGHHVYNGSAWVNEGLLAESEARTNLTLYSEDFSQAYWDKNSTSITSGTAVSPTGLQTADTLTATSTGNFRYIDRSVSLTQNETYTFSVYLKYTDTQWVWLLGETSFNTFFWFDIQNGVLGGSGTSVGNPFAGESYSHAIQDVGNGWYRCSITFTKSSANGGEEIGFGLADADENTNATLNQTCLAYGPQLEVGSTPSSYIPTDSATVTRPAETFTIPSANLPWPEPSYIGSELVTNGTFDTDSDWTKGTGWSISGGDASYDGSGTGYQALSQFITTTSGSVYEIKFDVTAETGTLLMPVDFGSVRVNTNHLSVGSYEFYAVADGATENLLIYARDADTLTVDNISVREINPLSVSIAMDGAVTYADEDSSQQVYLVNWYKDSSNMIRTWIDTTQGTGAFDFRHTGGAATDIVTSGASSLSPNVLVPYSICQRHGSTFVNGAVNGVALTANTTPTVLPDLSTRNLNIPDVRYMGTVSSIRVWDKDLGDDGIVEATNPSLEPSLSLTFEGTGTNSFVVNNWSE